MSVLNPLLTLDSGIKAQHKSMQKISWKGKVGTIHYEKQRKDKKTTVCTNPRVLPVTEN